MTNPFTSFAFSASGANQVNRTLPDRLVEVRSIVDWGADPTGNTDSWAAIMACIFYNRYSRTAAASNQAATFTGVVAGAAFTGTISGNNLTINSGLTGTVAVGQTITSGAVSCQITSGSGTSWVVNGAPQTVGPVAMTTNTILVASSVVGTISVNDHLLNNGGTDASPSTTLLDTQIASQQSGTSGGAGVYVLTWATPFGIATMQNFVSQAMMTVSAMVSLTVPVPAVAGQFAFDTNNSTVARAFGGDNSVVPGDGISATVSLAFPPGSTITFNRINGLVSAGDTIGIDPGAGRGRVFVPPGNFSVSRPINLSASQAMTNLFGAIGATITGNFNDYVITQSEVSPSTATRIETLTVINTHATGGGIRLGATLPGAVRRCTIIANRGLSDYSADDKASAGAYFGSLEVAFEDCDLSPGPNVSGSIGIMRQSDGPVTNCKIVGYENGFQCAGGEGAQVLMGNYFEKCGTAINLNRGPDGGRFVASAVVIIGNWFKNNSVAINAFGSSGLLTIGGNYIEGATGQAPGGLNPQYGIVDGTGPGVGQGNMSQSMIAGINIVGNYDVAGIYFSGHNSNVFGPTFEAVSDNGVSPHPFMLDPQFGNYLPTQIACNARHICTVAQLPASGTDAGQELDVSDGTNGLAWGASVTNTGTHTTPNLVRWNGSNWTVMGK